MPGSMLQNLLAREVSGWLSGSIPFGS